MSLAGIRDVLWVAQGGCCWLCGQTMQKRGSNHPHSASLDHVWPKATHGELGDIGLTLLAHRDCNARRGSPMPSEDDVRALVRIWRAVDRRWLRTNLRMVESDLATLEVRRKRVELLKILEAA